MTFMERPNETKLLRLAYLVLQAGDELRLATKIIHVFCAQESAGEVGSLWCNQSMQANENR